MQYWGWELQFQRLKTSIAEIDLVFQKGNKVCLIEVKTLDDPWRSFERVSLNQIQKLKLNQINLATIFKREFVFSSFVAWVSDGKIDYVKIC